MAKNRRIGNLLALILSIVIIAFTITLTVQQVVLNNLDNKTQLSSSEPLSNEFYDALLSQDKVGVSTLSYTDKDVNNRTITINAINITGAGTANKILEIPQTLSIYENDRQVPYTVTKIDFTNWYKNEDNNANEIWGWFAQVQALIIPKSVKTITEGSFFGFDSLVYLEVPFIGTERGSSAFGQNEGGTSIPLAKMFRNVHYSNNNNMTMSYGYETIMQKDINGNITFPFTGNKISVIPAKWAENNIKNPEIYNIPGTLKKIVISDETNVGNRALFNLGEAITSGSIISGYRGVECIEIYKQEGAKFTFGNYALSENYNLSSVKIPEEGVGLSVGCFSHCSSLKSITLPKKLISIPESTFSECMSLKSALIPSTVETIGSGAFSGCIALDEVYTYRDTSSSIEDSIISSNYKINLPSALKKIDSDAFAKCYLFKELIVPTSVTYIGPRALNGCVNLELLSVPFAGAHRGNTHSNECIKDDEIYHSLFGYIFGSTSIEGTYDASQGFNEGVPASKITYKIPSKLKTIIISDDTVVSYGAFHGLKSVESLTIGGSCAINKKILGDCDNLKELSISNLDFNLSELFITATNQNLYDSASAYRIPQALENVILTNDIKVESGIFNNCAFIKYVEIQKATQWINYGVFYNNPSLETLVLPFVGVRRGERDRGSYGNQTDADMNYADGYGCYGRYVWWRDAALQNSLISIFSATEHAGTYKNECLSSNYFHNYARWIPSSLKTVEITDETVIGYYSFLSFSSLESLIINGDPSSIAGGCMSGCSSLRNLNVPYIGVNANLAGLEGYDHVLGYFFGSNEYENSYAVSQFRTYYIPGNLKSITIGSGVNSICNRSFADCKSIETIYTDASISSLQDRAFYGCTNLSSLNMSNAMYSNVGAYAFYNCSKVNDIDKFIPDTATSLGDYSFAKTSISTVDLSKYSNVGAYAFSNCLNIAEITIPNDVTIQEGVFQDCQYLNNVNLIQKVLTKNLFKNCISLENINITGVLNIPEGVFSGCVSLKFSSGDSGLIQDDNTESIGAYAFYNCTSLTRFSIRPSTTTIGTYAFSGCINLEYMTIPKETINIKGHAWDNCNPNFYFYVYAKEENWPTTWVDNWNCYYPVYVIGETETETFTYEYSKDYKGYFITGVNDGVTLSGVVRIPSRYQGLKVIGINKKGPNLLSNQHGINTVIIPTSIIQIEAGVFVTNNRVDIYFEATESQVRNTYNTTNKCWEVGVDDLNFITKGLIFYKNDWEYDDNQQLPHVKLDNVTIQLDAEEFTYDGQAKTPPVNFIKLPGYVKNVNNEDSYNEIHTVDILNYSYIDNVKAGKATVRGVLNLRNYNKFVSTQISAGGPAIRFIEGEVENEFLIKKAVIVLYGYDFKNVSDGLLKPQTVTGIYNETEHMINSWGTTNVSGLPNGGVFSGILTTKSKNVGSYIYESQKNDTEDKYGNKIFNKSNSAFRFDSWSVTVNGVNVTDNYTISLTLKYEILPMNIYVKLSEGVENPDNPSLYQYRYTGLVIKPTAKAYSVENNQEISNIRLGTQNYNTDGVVYPTLETNHVYVYISSDLDNKNYNLQCFDTQKNAYVDEELEMLDVIGLRKASKLDYIVINGLVKVTINIDYFISPDEDCAKIELNETSGYITGLGTKSHFFGTLISNNDIAGMYIYGQGINQMIWDRQTLPNGHNGEYLIYKLDGGTPVSEMDYYDVEISANVNIRYTDFKVDYIYYDLANQMESGRVENPTPTSDDGRFIIDLEYYTEGFGYELRPIPTNFNSTTGKNFTLTHWTTDNDGKQVVTKDPLSFNAPGVYWRGLTVEGRHFNTYQVTIRLTVKKSSIKIDSNLDREYNRKPVDLMAEGKILKYPVVDAETANLTIKYYRDAAGINEIAAPMDIGTYYTRITANESEFFNKYDSGYLMFKITKRKIIIDISGSRPYDGYTFIMTPQNEDLVQAGYVLNADDNYPADQFSGSLYSASASAGNYNKNNIVWSPTWNVYNSLQGDVTSNYEVVIAGVYTIQKLNFSYNVSNYRGPYDGQFHTGSVTVTNPSSGYTIYYSDTYITEGHPSLSTVPQTRAMIGEYVIYFVIEMDNYNTITGSYTISILPLQIEYKEYNGQTNDEHTYIVQYTGAYIRYEIDIISPYNTLVEYQYGTSEYTVQAFEFLEAGEYRISYRLTAPNHKYVNGYVIFIISHGEIQLPDEYKVINCNVEYDGSEHCITLSYPQTGYMNIYYSLDEIEWQTENFKFIECGIYTVYVKFVVPGYEVTIKEGTVEIYGHTFEGLSLSNYIGTYDGKYHTIDLLGDNINQKTDDYGNTLYFYKDTQIQISYTSNPNNVDAQSGFVPSLSYKDAGVYYIYVMVEALNYQTTILGDGATQGKVEILIINNPTGRIEYQEFQYSTFTNDKLAIDTIHDGIRTYYYYLAVYDESSNSYLCDFSTRTTLPTELGYYYVRVDFLPTNNAHKMTLSPLEPEYSRFLTDAKEENDNFIKIIPKVAKVVWNETEIYDGLPHSPDPKAITGTSDELSIVYNQISPIDQEPILVGQYEFSVFMFENNPNYVLDRDRIIMNIVKIKIDLELHFEYEVKTENGKFVPWSKDQGWEEYNLNLLDGHKFVASMKTSDGVVATYYYKSDSTQIYRNRVDVTYDILDENNNSVKDSYDITISVTVRIRYPLIDLSSIKDTVVTYDGVSHIPSITLDGHLNGAVVQYKMKDSQDEWSGIPSPQILAGKYEYTIRVSKANYETTEGTIKLIIEKCDLDIEIDPIDDPETSLDDEYKIYSALEKTLGYSILNVVHSEEFGADGKATHVLYYPASKVTLTQLEKLYENFTETNSIYSYGLESMINAGVYYCVVYYQDSQAMWNESYAIREVEVVRKDIHIDFKTPFNYSAEYNKQKISIPLANATIHNEDLISSHTINHDLLYLYTVRTISANAGYYDPKTDFEFGEMQILDEYRVNVAENYRPVLSDNVHVEILRGYLNSDTFMVEDFEKEYDGYRNIPTVITDSDGEITYTYYEYPDGDMSLPPTKYNGVPVNVGAYYVGVSIGQGTNYYSSSTARPGSTEPPIGTLYANVIVTKKNQEITWNDLEQVFTGEELKPSASFVDVYGNTINLDVLFLDFDINPVITYGKLLAGSYEAFASFNNDYKLYSNNYNLINNSTNFIINKRSYTINIGDVISENADAAWHEDVNDSMINDFPDNFELSGIDGQSKIFTIYGDAGYYQGKDNFIIEIIVKLNDLDITNSIEFDVKGSVTIIAKNIIFNAKDATVEYSGSAYRLDVLNILNVTTPTSGYNIQYRVNSQDGESWTNVIPEFTNVGEYVVEFQISVTNYNSAKGSLTVTILPRESFVNLQNLNKTYDGQSHDLKNKILSSGYNGNIEDLVFEYYLQASDGTYTILPDGELPIDAGNYMVRIYNQADYNTSQVLNYLPLDVEYTFTISPKTIDFKVELDEKITNGTFIGLSWQTQVIEVGATYVPDLTSGETIKYQISTKNLQRNTYQYKGKLDFIPATASEEETNSLNKFTATTKKKALSDSDVFTITWMISTQDQQDNKKIISLNYVLNIDFFFYCHYEEMEVEITGEKVSYNGQPHYGSVNFINPVESTVKQYYSTTRPFDPNNEETLDGAYHSIDAPEVSFTNAGKHVVYYLFISEGYEESYGSFTIDISYIERNLMVTAEDKIYDGKPIFEKPVGSEYYLPKFDNLRSGNDGYPADDYTINEVKITYYLDGRVAPIDASIGCIDAGNYKFTLVIPQSTNYSETIHYGEFTINRRTLKVKDNLGFKHTYNGSSANFNFANNQSEYEVFYIDNKGEETPISSTLAFKGYLVTTTSNVKKYTGEAQNLVWYQTKYTITDNGEDVSKNYLLNIDEASIEITPANMTVQIDDTYTFSYNNEMKTIESKFTVKMPVSGWEISYYNKEINNWSSKNTYQGFNDVGPHETKIKISAPNFTDFIKVVNIVIEKATPDMKIISDLNKKYDGIEVFIPEKISDHPEHLNTNNFTYIYDVMIDNTYKNLSVIWWDNDLEDYVINAPTSISRPVNVGKYRIIIEIPETDNYLGVQILQEFEISAKKITANWNNKNFTYDGTQKSPTATFDFEEVDINSTQVIYKYTPLTNEDHTHTNAGVYKVEATLDVNNDLGNYVIDSSTNQCQFTITKKETTISLSSLRSFGSMEYIFTYASENPGVSNFSASLCPNHTITSDLVCSKTSGGPYTKISDFSWKSDTGSLIIRDNTGKDVTSNYYVKYNLSFSISSSPIEYSANAVEVPYDGASHGIVVEVSSNSGNFEILYSTTHTSDPSMYTNVNPTYVNVKFNPVENKVEPYMVYFMIKDLNGNYEPVFGESSVTITPAPANISLEDANNNPKLDKIYDGKTVLNPKVIYDGTGNEILTYTYYRWETDNNYTRINSNPYAAGRYKLVISLATEGNYNYTSSSLEFEFTIEKREIIIYTSNKISKYYDGMPWKYDIVANQPANLAPNEKVKYGTIISLNFRVGQYNNESDFDFENGIIINNAFDDKEDIDRTSNYNIIFDFDLTIKETKFNATAANYEGTYDGESHTIGTPVLSSVKIEGIEQIVPLEYTVTYSENPNDGFAEALITRTYVGETTVYYKIEADNFEPFIGSAKIRIHGRDFDFPDDGDDGGDGGEDGDPSQNPNDPDYDPDNDGIYIRWEKNYVYSGEPYPTPYYVCPSQGEQTVVYYKAEDYDSRQNEMSSVTDAGNYVMVIKVAEDTVYEAGEVSQSFSILRKTVEVEWEGLSFVFGTPLLANVANSNVIAKYKNVFDTYVNAIVNLETIVDDNNLVKVGNYNLTAKTLDTNYLLTNEQAELTITRKLITAPVIREDLYVEYLSELEIFDTDGNQYIIDEDGKIIKIIYADGSTPLENPDLLYYISLDGDKNADGVVVNVHKLRLELVARDSNNYYVDENYEWEILNNTDPIEVQYKIKPIEFPHDIYSLNFAYQYSWIWDDSYLPGLEPEVLSTVTYDSLDGTKTITLELGQLDASGKHDGDYYIVYSNNTNVPEDGNPSVMNIIGNRNYVFNTNQYFQILAAEPEILMLKQNATIQFITAEYDYELGQTYFTEDEKVEARTNETKDTYNYFLGHVYQSTFIIDVLNQFVNDINMLQVYDSNNELVAFENYELAYFGTGYRIVLIDKNRREVDSITSILFGDINGDGLIGIADANTILQIVSGKSTFDSLGDCYYYSSFVNRNLGIVTLSFYNEILRHINGEIELNSDYNPSISG